MICLQPWAVPGILKKAASLVSFLPCFEGKFVVTVGSYWVNNLCTYRGSSVDSKDMMLQV